MGLNNFKFIPKALMFHHFHKNTQDKYVKNSLNSQDFEKIIKKIGKKNILSADLWFEKFKSQSLKKNEYCFTFDDGLKSQFRIALPILKKYNIKCFWFIFSSIFNKEYDQNEINKYFYTKSFKNFSDFFYYFKNELNSLKKKNHFLKPLHQKKANNYLKKFKFYTEDEKLYRYLRDFVLTKKEFLVIHKKLFKKFKFSEKKVVKKLWISKEDLKKIINLRHVIGLHSHSHSSNITDKKYYAQYLEYKNNLQSLKKIYNRKIFSSSHPFNRFNQDSIKALKKLGITLSFKALYDKKFDAMSLPRIDSVNILKANFKVEK